MTRDIGNPDCFAPDLQVMLFNGHLKNVFFFYKNKVKYFECIFSCVILRHTLSSHHQSCVHIGLFTTVHFSVFTIEYTHIFIPVSQLSIPSCLGRPGRSGGCPCLMGTVDLLCFVYLKDFIFE
jgi:hypothetical protein